MTEICQCDLLDLKQEVFVNSQKISYCGHIGEKRELSVEDSEK